MNHSSSIGAMSSGLPDMDKLKTQAETVNGTVLVVKVVVKRESTLSALLHSEAFGNIKLD